MCRSTKYDRAYPLKQKLVSLRQSSIVVTSATDNFQQQNTETINIRLLCHLSPDRIFRSQVSSGKGEQKTQVRPKYTLHSNSLKHSEQVHAYIVPATLVLT